VFGSASSPRYSKPLSSPAPVLVEICPRSVSAPRRSSRYHATGNKEDSLAKRMGFYSDGRIAAPRWNLRVVPDGRVAIRTRKSVIAAQPHPNCVNEVGLHAADPELTTTTRLPDTTKVKRYGKMLRPAFQACSSDPNIVGACYKIHGRISAYNGTPTLRIWRIGTDRILGVEDDISVPEPLSRQLGWDVDVYADFELCPFTHERDERRWTSAGATSAGNWFAPPPLPLRSAASGSKRAIARFRHLLRFSVCGHV
jgi:hypothetical protein